MIKSVVFDSGQPGPHLLILGAVHGNEPCGPIAIRKVLRKFRGGSWVLKKGRVTFVPICNPGAHLSGVRQVDRNLNRHFYPKDNPVAYEDFLDNKLAPILEQADLVIDLHSYTVGRDPYILIEAPAREDIALAAALGIKDVLYGWAEAYDAAGMASDPLESQGLVNYARTKGITALTVECGQHDDPRSVVVARETIENALVNLGYIDGTPTETAFRLFHIRHSVFKQRPGDFVQKWDNMQPIREGDLIARYADGEEVKALHDGVILLTKPWAYPGGEWFNTAVEDTIP